MNKEGIVIILVKPEFLGNIGATARVMKNFGFSQMRLVSPPRNYKDAEARKMAVDAFEILKNATVHDTLTDALTDVQIAIGTTSGKQRKTATVVADELLDRLSVLSPDKTAIVFGNERDGLSNDDLDRCHHASTIATNDDFSSLNLAQAVAIYAYELTRPRTKVPLAESPLTNGKADDELFIQLEELLERAEFTRSYNKTQLLTQLRSFYQRAHSTQRENSVLLGALHKINQKLQSRQPDI